jgi:hypothetical protein
VRLRSDTTPPPSPLKSDAGHRGAGTFLGSGVTFARNPHAAVPLPFAAGAFHASGWGGAPAGAAGAGGDTGSRAASPSTTLLTNGGLTLAAAAVGEGQLPALRVPAGAPHRLSLQSSADSGSPLVAQMRAAASGLRISDDTSRDATPDGPLYGGALATAGTAAPGAPSGPGLRPAHRGRKHKLQGRRRCGGAGGDESDEDYVPGSEGSGGGGAAARQRGRSRGWSCDVGSDGDELMRTGPEGAARATAVAGAAVGQLEREMEAPHSARAVNVALRSVEALPHSPRSAERRRSGRPNSKEPKPSLKGPW